MTTATAKPGIILIAGPYRSGTDGDPERIAANLVRLEAASWPVYDAGHVPMIGEWVGLPVIRAADEAGRDPEHDVLYETAGRLIAHCDGVLRLPGASAGADRDVELARERGIPVYTDAADIPRAG
ncbi:DUF4406 domain-containing protein [Agromyces seonyuensis]|uniref:DUF4406 domain-containing protein n=1 Tax=Agromyces seonyuensis TaxID=2662446 RepID=A0A6I4P435_9MICO|nr:DUF4406 domain-containing protein [Agromyces seonyuensis]MWB99615.1 DUF4406 domain-containing protein [Agromyces seonyuensis]